MFNLEFLYRTVLTIPNYQAASTRMTSTKCLRETSWILVKIIFWWLTKFAYNCFYSTHGIFNLGFYTKVIAFERILKSLSDIKSSRSYLKSTLPSSLNTITFRDTNSVEFTEKKSIINRKKGVVSFCCRRYRKPMTIYATNVEKD